MRFFQNFTAAFLLTLVGFCVHADGFDDTPLLRESFDPDLQRGLVSTLTRLGLASAIPRRQLAVALVDITDPHQPKVAAVNGDEMFYAASLPKIAILLGAFVEIDAGRMRLDANTRMSLTRMIRASSNEDATRMLNRVGKYRLAQILKSEPFRLYDPAVNGGLWVGKEYATGAAFLRDPLHNLSHGATALQTARFYYLLETGQLVSSQACAAMKEMLSDPAINHKFVKGLSRRPEARIFRKSGTWRRWHSDSAVVESAGHKFIVVALAENEAGGRWLETMITPLHDLIVPPRFASR